MEPAADFILSSQTEIHFCAFWNVDIFGGAL